MSVERDIRYDLIARLCPNATGAELKSVATEVSTTCNLNSSPGCYVPASVDGKV
jgi:ATP-dependent 26S proteasome regulatory subunit